MPKQKQGKKSKAGRNKKKPCHLAYTSERRWLRNAERRLQRLCRRWPNNKQLANRLHSVETARAYTGRLAP